MSLLTQPATNDDRYNVGSSTSLHYSPTGSARKWHGPPDPRRVRVLYPGSAASRWLSLAAERLGVLLALDKGWDSYGAAPVDEATAGRVLSLLDAIMSGMSGEVAPPFIAPLSDGGLQVEWATKQRDVGFIVKPDDEPVGYISSDDIDDEWYVSSPWEVSRLAVAVRALENSQT
jgi:hypothetical protein